MHSSDLLDVELYNDNLKMFSQSREERPSQQVNTHEACEDLTSAGPCSEKGAEKVPKIEDYGK